MTVPQPPSVRSYLARLGMPADVRLIKRVRGLERSLMVLRPGDLFGESGVPFIDMAANQVELGTALKGKLEALFERYGLALDSFVVQNVTLPEELQKILDTKISMNMIGDMGRFTQFQVANAIPLAAQNEGGLAGMGAGLGAGMGIGQGMAQAMTQAMQPGAAQPAAATPVTGVSADDVVATLEKLHGLVAKGILSQAEFDTKKAELLGKLS